MPAELHAFIRGKTHTYCLENSGVWLFFLFFNQLYLRVIDQLVLIFSAISELLSLTTASPLTLQLHPLLSKQKPEISCSAPRFPGFHMPKDQPTNLLHLILMSLTQHARHTALLNSITTVDKGFKHGTGI